MAPMLTFVASLAAVVAASGQSLPFVETVMAGGLHGLRGRVRQLQEEGMCNAIGCPEGSIPIPEAMDVECEDDPCEPSQCCISFCSFHPCGIPSVPILDADDVMCPVSGCTDDLCCADLMNFSFNFEGDDSDDSDDFGRIIGGIRW